MFEKSLYDLIRGLRNHKGNEREYIQASLRECRKEIKGQDMDVKATAVLKLTYLEMFGHDMSWASFNVLEVMSSAKYAQKKVGYLGAVQSFRSDTEVLMLAENLLKKDLTSAVPTTIALPLGAIPHVINPSMANSLLSDLLPRLTHSHPAVRKKTLVTLYRLALVFPETLRPAWPKIKERLLDEGEDPSVTAAIVNVVCELGWRRPQDFLPLAPRFFDLLVQGGNNWMAIKIIKLFATLTPLEPRLVKKLLPPLTNIIKTTPAMSLLYECVDGIIQGGILDATEGTAEGEEIARLCVGKLRGMLVVEGDPNLKFVALLAFTKIVSLHPHLVSLHQDVILECVDDLDISIRSKALDLVVGMVNSDNLPAIVGRLMRQLRNEPVASATDVISNDRGSHNGVEPAADSDEDEAEESLRSAERRSKEQTPLPENYRVNVIKQILAMCSRDTYVNVTDFEWYIDVIVQLVKVCPTSRSMGVAEDTDLSGTTPMLEPDVSCSIGQELQNVAVRVKTVRREATRAAQSLTLIEKRDQLFPASGNGGRGVLESAIWLVGEYSALLSDPQAVLASLLHSNTVQLSNRILAISIQAIPKVFSVIAGSDRIPWTRERKSMVSLLLAKVIHFLEPLTTHANFEVQERAVEYLELMRLAAEAAAGQDTESRDSSFLEPPLLLTQAIPSLFAGMELNPVAPGAQGKVPLPDDIDLDAVINPNLQSLLAQADIETGFEAEEDDSSRFYHQRPAPYTVPEAAADRLEPPKSETVSYQQTRDEDQSGASVLARRKAERRERYKDDPFYIASDSISDQSTPLNSILRNSNGEEVDIDAIPIMDLSLDDNFADQRRADEAASSEAKRRGRKRIEIMGDESLDQGESSSAEASRPDVLRTAQTRAKKSLLEVDSSGLGLLSLEGGGSGSQLDIQRRELEEAEMAKALEEVERLRLEMQRAAERVQPKDAPPEGTLVKKKKKAKKTGTVELTEGGEEGVVKKKKKKKKKEAKEGESELVPKVEPSINPKKKKRREVRFNVNEEPGDPGQS